MIHRRSGKYDRDRVEGSQILKRMRVTVITMDPLSIVAQDVCIGKRDSVNTHQNHLFSRVKPSAGKFQEVKKPIVARNVQEKCKNRIVPKPFVKREPGTEIGACVIPEMGE